MAYPDEFAGIGTIYGDTQTSASVYQTGVTIDNREIPDLQPQWTNTLLKEAFEGSIVGKLIPSEPMPLTGKDVPVYDGTIEVGLVGEAQQKPLSKPGTFSVKSMRTAKVATIVVVSKELADANPLKLLNLVQADMRNSLARAVDSLVLFNHDMLGVSYTGVNVPVVGTGNGNLYLGADTALTGTDLIDAFDLITNEDADPNGWVFDTRQRATLTRILQAAGQPYPNPAWLPDLAGGVTNVVGFPAHFSKAFRRVGAIAGDPAGAADIVGVLGDWSKVRWGYVEKLDITRSKEATIRGVSMFETNQIALLIEATLGWTNLAPDAFAVIRAADEPLP